ncbi:MAG: UvrD-helicase domain-containing protein [Colwellia sp.]|uniref:UvrD-helicase domain-containing protein n=1 Tax=Alteromonadales TaxID=135622 RepID=UPI001E176A21|nr:MULTISPECIES: UvrD-helicase domain-containing protein [Alteromonadales]NQZ27439.1 UvrD-helicase domain-containing protein [Colwellia sp.]NRA80332.1 UvrD-helicase domain-containing protein [Pseudoalteromonas sp.]
MSSIHSFLSCDSALSSKPFSDTDIKWVESILGLNHGFDKHQLDVLQNIDNLDVEACPGSGKTTVLVAKLALLARYWKPINQGICVLSMTNAARDEIQERLGGTAEGQILLHPPHFIGTIHSFFSEFLAKPYLNSNGMAIVSIDDDFSRSQRLKTLQKKPYLILTDHLLAEQRKKRTDIIENNNPTTQKYADAKAWLKNKDEETLEEQRLGIPVHWRMIDTVYNVSTVQGQPLDLPDSLLPILRNVIKEVVDKGIFGFSDIFLYSKALMKSSVVIFNIIRTRFPLLLIDEAQDTSCSQAEIIYDLFLADKGSNNEKVIRQRFGDANQTIYTFEKPMARDGVDPYPSPYIAKLTIPVSHRFDQSIAAIASTFETNPLQIPMRGMRKEVAEGKNHCILIFNEETRNQVIPSFAEYALKELLNQNIQDSQIRVCSHIHKAKDDKPSGEEFARTIQDYYSPYIAENMTKEYQQHKYFIDYVRHARFLVKETKDIKIGVDKIAEGIYKLCLILNEEVSSSTIGSPFFRIKSLNNKHRAISNEINEIDFYSYSEKAIGFLLLNSKIIETSWREFLMVVCKVVNFLLSQKNIKLDENKFLKWKEEDEAYESQKDEHWTGIEKGNIYRHQIKGDESKTIDIKLGTIHSVKGQTHTASLLLESTNRGPILGQLKSYLLGNDEAKDSKGNKRSWLNTLYVGLTRPTHLICLAIPESHKKYARAKAPVSWTEEDFESLKAMGWKVARVKKDSDLEFI